MITLTVPRREWVGDTPRSDIMKALDRVEALLVYQLGGVTRDGLVEFVEAEQEAPLAEGDVIENDQ